MWSPNGDFGGIRLDNPWFERYIIKMIFSPGERGGLFIKGKWSLGCSDCASRRDLLRFWHGTSPEIEPALILDVHREGRLSNLEAITMRRMHRPPFDLTSSITITDTGEKSGTTWKGNARTRRGNNPVKTKIWRTFKILCTHSIKSCFLRKVLIIEILLLLICHIYAH